MTSEDRKNQVKSFLGKTVRIKIDRPIGYIHKKGNYTLTYPINYGYIPDVIGSDGEELDVYLLGVNEAVKEFKVRIIGIAHRENDNEDKLIAAPVGMMLTREEAAASIDFQEKYFNTYIEMVDVKIHNFIVKYDEIKTPDLPEEVAVKIRNAIVIKADINRFIIEDSGQFFNKIQKLKPTPEQLHLIYMNTDEIIDEHNFFDTVLSIYKRANGNTAPDTAFKIEIIDYINSLETVITEITE